MLIDTKFQGNIEEMGSSRIVSDWVIRRSYIKIGGQKLRNVLASDGLDDFAATLVDNKKDVTLNVGWAIFNRCLLSITAGSETERLGILLFVSLIVAHMFFFGIIGWLAGAITSVFLPEFIARIIGFGIIGCGALTSLLNIKAWLRI